MWREYTKALKFPESYISMGLGFLVVVVAGLLIFNFFNRAKTSNTGQQTNLEVSLQPGTQVQPVFPVPTVHTVSQGENLWTIAEKYYRSGYNWVTIAKDNNLSNPNIIEVGQKLKIPSSQSIVVGQGDVSSTSIERIMGDTYTVKKGDDLWNIAVRAYADGYKWVTVSKANNLVNPNTIHVGNVLKIPR